jgi:hypothetical protein
VPLLTCEWADAAAPLSEGEVGGMEVAEGGLGPGGAVEAFAGERRGAWESLLA